MTGSEQTQFLQQLAEDLNSKCIELPSFPDVVINIRTALEDPKCTSERLAEVVRTDPVLVARLLMAANSAFHNRAGIEIVDLNLAISRLGFEVVRNTAITLAVEQIFVKNRRAGLGHGNTGQHPGMPVTQPLGLAQPFTRDGIGHLLIFRYVVEGFGTFKREWLVLRVLEAEEILRRANFVTIIFLPNVVGRFSR